MLVSLPSLESYQVNYCVVPGHLYTASGNGREGTTINETGCERSMKSNVNEEQRSNDGELMQWAHFLWSYDKSL